jgi:putative transposase
MIAQHRARVGTRVLCEALGEPRSSWYRSRRTRPEAIPVRTSPRRLSVAEELAVLAVLDSKRFADMAPEEVHAVLLDEGTYLCSERTMYRILQRHGQSAIRRQAAPREYQKPELLATRPNEVWSWDITKLKGPAKWTYYYLYKIMDIFSRYVVGWMVAYREAAKLAEDLIAETVLKQEIVPGTLTLHADRGSSMTAATVGQLLLDLGVAKTHSRPHVSNDNPYSESAFKTLKYRPDFPDRFDGMLHARSFCGDFFAWYNTQHRHSGIAMLTPHQVHYGMWQPVLGARTSTLVNAYLQHPERFVRGVPSVKHLSDQVWINKPKNTEQNALVVS